MVDMILEHIISWFINPYPRISRGSKLFREFMEPKMVASMVEVDCIFNVLVTF